MPYTKALISAVPVPDPEIEAKRENHVVDGALASHLIVALAEAGNAPQRVLRLGLRGVPACGRNDEVLAHHGLDATGLTASLHEWLSAAREAA